MPKELKGGKKMSEENQEHNSGESSKSSKTITLKKSDLWKYSTFVLIAALIIVGIVVLKPFGTGQVVQNPNQQQGVVEASVDDDAVLGDSNAPVTIVEFSDYQCPYCRKFWTETFHQIKEQYIDTGKVKLVFRDLPLASLHPMAVKSAEAAECVREQGGDKAYFEYHDKVFAEQNLLDSGNEMGQVTKTVTYTENDLKSWAQDLGYDIGSCLDSGKYTSEVAKDFSDAQSAGFTGTPGFSINGVPLKGAYPFSEFQRIIESEL
jgi:protein-disulfide isomerase